MIRLCIHCKHIFGCHGFDGTKWKCNSCRHFDSCAIRMLLDPPVEDITGGICDWCFDNLVDARHKDNPFHDEDLVAAGI